MTEQQLGTLTDESPVPAGLRERHKRSTRLSLEDAALRLFAERGYDATTVEQIAEVAGVSPRTFFRYFAAKDEVLDMGWSVRREQLADLVAAVPPGTDALTAGTQVLLAMSASFEDQRDRVLLRARAVRTSPVLRGRNIDTLAAWEHTLAAGLARHHGLAEPDVAARTVAAACMGVWRSALGDWLQQPAGRSLGAVVGEAFDHLVRAAETAESGPHAGIRPR